MRELPERVMPAVLMLALSVLAFETAPAQSPDVAAMMARIEGAQVPNRQGFDGLTLSELMQRFRVPGISIAVMKDGRIHWAKGYGVADVATGRAVDTGTVFQAASISKPIFAMVTTKLAQDGRLSLDADVNSLLKTWKVPDSEHARDQKVTLRSLLSHTSGASDGFGFPGYNPDEPRPSLVQIITGEKPSNVGVVRFTRAPYVGFQYSGGGVTLAQLAVSDATGRPLAELADEILLKPLGLTRSSFEQPMTDRLAANAAFAHSGAGRRSGPASWHVYPEQAAAGLWTTPSDLARLAIEIQRANKGLKGTVLTQTSAREHLSPIGAGGYAVGFAVAQRGQGWYFSHGGSNWGFQCLLMAHFRKGYGVVIMTNGDAGGAVIGEIEGRVASAYGWDTLDKPIPR